MVFSYRIRSGFICKTILASAICIVTSFASAQTTNNIPNGPLPNPRAQAKPYVQPRGTTPNYAVQPATASAPIQPMRLNTNGTRPRGTNPAQYTQQNPSKVAAAPGRQPVARQPRLRPRAMGARFPKGFPLTKTDEAYCDQVLKMWEAKSGKVQTYKNQFERWQYSITDNIQDRSAPLLKETGEVAYSKPDKGSFHVKEVKIRAAKIEKDANGKPVYKWDVDKVTIGEHWVSDGKNTYNFNAKANPKQLEVQAIPKEFQGKSIADGPLPFLFGAEAAKLKKRYWIKITHSTADEIWMEAYPKTIKDARNYKKVDIILHQITMLPKTMQVHEPNGNRSLYFFKEATVNSRFDRMFGGFKAPSAPFGWKKVFIDAPQPRKPAIGLQPRKPGTTAVKPSAPRAGF